jgi:hypothetical protein
MRGYDLCRSHRDPIFGPLGGGAPKGNRNAVKTGAYTHALPPETIRRLAHRLTSEPDKYIDHMTWALKSLHYPRDLCVSLQILVILIRQLQPQIATDIFIRELDAYVDLWPAEAQSQLRAHFWQSMHNADPIERLYIFRETIETMPPPGIDDQQP